MKKPKKIEFASQDEVDFRRAKMDRLLAVIGHPEAWVSNASRLSDFTALDTEQQQAILESIEQVYGIVLSPHWLDHPLYKLVDFLERPESDRLKN